MASSGLKRLVPPRPPSDFAAIELDATTNTRTVYYRLSPSSYASPLFFSRKGLYRFDSASAKWGVCYLAEEIESCVLEVFADQIRHRLLDFAELDAKTVWRIVVPADLHLLHLAGPTLPKIKATLQCFVSRYTLSQEWGRAFMDHPENLDGVIYRGRQSGGLCLGLFGDTDPKQGRWHQSSLRAQRLGKLTEWEGFYPLLDRAGARVRDLPALPRNLWQAP